MDTAHPHEPSSEPRDRAALWSLTVYFLKLGTIGFGGPPALIGYMHRDLVEREQSLDEGTYKLALALAQIMPGPLAAQTAAVTIGLSGTSTAAIRQQKWRGCTPLHL